MAQKPRNCTTTILDKKFNYDICPRLLRNEKRPIDPQKYGRKLKSSTGTLAVPNPNNYVHKEVITDNAALVEVTVRTQTMTKKPPNAGKESWNKLLTKNGDSLSSFGCFDPLRTVHFLSKELQAKLRASTPNDTKVMEIISDMQQALNRVPPEIFSPVYTFEPPEKLKRRVEEKGCQTVDGNRSSSESEAFQRHLEASTVKLEASCKQMEELCVHLKKEKELAEHRLSAERDTVRYLQKQMDELQLAKIESKNAIFEKLHEEKGHLQAQVELLQEQLDLNRGPTTTILKARIQELQADKSVVAREVTDLQHELTLRNMEKEKYVAILQVRDRQIDEIQGEISRLQAVVNEQLNEMQRQPQLSATSSRTSIADNYGIIPWHKKIKHGNGNENDEREMGDMGLCLVNAPMTRLFMNCKDFESGDSSPTNVDNERRKVPEVHQLEILETPKFKTDSSDMSAVYDLLSTLKTHAFMVNVPPLPFDNDNLK